MISNYWCANWQFHFEHDRNIVALYISNVEKQIKRSDFIHIHRIDPTFLAQLTLGSIQPGLANVDATTWKPPLTSRWLILALQ